MSTPVVHLQRFPERSRSTLRIFCPNPTSVITSFEDYLPGAHTIGRLFSDMQPHQPARLCWIKAGFEYYAYLPKDRIFDGHIWEPLKCHTPTHIERNGRWYVDEETSNLWRAIDWRLTKSIEAISRDTLFMLHHHEPRRAIQHGFTQSHRTQENLQLSLHISKHAIVHRLAYLLHLISFQYRWGESEQPWRKALEMQCGLSWVDSIWDALCRQWKSRNFIGVVVRPEEGTSIRWLEPALRFGVPIWVLWPNRDPYKGQDGDFKANLWKPEVESVRATQLAEIASAKLRAQPTATPPPPPPPPPPTHPTNPHLQPPANPAPAHDLMSISPPPTSTLPEGAKWYESWQEFFNNQKEADKSHLEKASQGEKQRWESLTRNSAKFQPPGKGGAKVYVWEACDSGGFLRILQNRHDVGRDWDYYFREALVFSARHNTWDHCPFMWEPAMESGNPDDDDDDGHVEDDWYLAPAPPVALPDVNPSPSDFLYHHYGFLSTEPTAPPTPILPLSSTTAHRTVGLVGEESHGPLPHLTSFICSTLQGQVPAGHCDLDFHCPPAERFPPTGRTFIYDNVFGSQFLELSDSLTFVSTNDPNDPNNSLLLVIHSSLSVLRMVRVNIGNQLTAKLHHLLSMGSQFTLLYPHTHQVLEPPHTNFITFPILAEGWAPTLEDYRAYTSRLKTYLLDRPHMVAAAFSRGGIAWRITQEIVGMEGSVEALLNTYPRQDTYVRTRQGPHWFHHIKDSEWFYLVGGYEVLTGLTLL